MIEMESIAAEVAGIKILFLTPVIPDDAPSRVREGLARRRIALLDGVCPCGATRPPMSRQIRRRAARTGQLDPAWLVFEHERDCAAVDTDALAAWITNTRRTSR